MQFDLAVLFVVMRSTITAYPSNQNALGSDTYWRDEDVSAIELDSMQISSLRKTYVNSFPVSAYSNLDKKDFTSDPQLAPMADGSGNGLSVALRFEDERCPHGSVSREEKPFCSGKTKIMTPNPSEVDDLYPQRGKKPEPDDTTEPAPKKLVSPGSSLQIVPPESFSLPEGSPLLELLPSEDLSLPGGKKCTRPETSRHVCCDGPLGEIQGIGSSKFYRTVENCNLCKLY